MASCSVCGNEVSGESCSLCGETVRSSAPTQPQETLAPSHVPTKEVSPSTTPTLPTSASATAPDRSRLVLGGIAAAALLSAAIVFAVKSGGPEDGDPAVAATQTETVVSESTAGLGEEPELTSDSTELEGSQTPEADGVVREMDAGTWILVFKSLEQDRYAADDALEQAQEISGSVVVDSSSISGLRAGYWAIASVGYSSQQTAREACSDFGLELGGECYERLVE